MRGSPARIVPWMTGQRRQRAQSQKFMCATNAKSAEVMPTSEAAGLPAKSIAMATSANAAKGTTIPSTFSRNSFCRLTDGR